MDVHYTQKPGVLGRYLARIGEGELREYSRGDMVVAICDAAHQEQAKQVRFFIEGSEEPVQMPGSVLKRLHQGQITAYDLIIESPRRGAETHKES